MSKMILQKPTPYKAIIFDLGGVLFTWEPPPDASIPPNFLKNILASQIWHDYERGNLTQDECHQTLASHCGVDVSDIALTVNQAQQSLATNLAIRSLLLEIKVAIPDIAVYAMSNLSKPDVQRAHPEVCIFDRIFPSGLHGARKPQTDHRKVLDEIGMSAEQIIFIDDQLDNIMSAQSIGMHDILYTQPALLSQPLNHLLLDPVQRGMEYLHRHAKALYSTVDNGQPVRENFSQLLILEATGDETLISLERHESTWNFFQGPPTFTTSTFPDDVDTTSLAWLTLPAPEPMISALLDRITTTLVNDDGIVTTYFTSTRPRTDPVVCTNVLRLLHKYNHPHPLPTTLTWIHHILLHRTYLHGTRYYPTPESFLYAVSQLCTLPSTQTPALKSLREILIPRLKERLNVQTDALALGLRILACLHTGIPRHEIANEVTELMARQHGDGSWDAGCFCRFGASKLNLFNTGLTTAVAVRVMRGFFGDSESVTINGV